MTQDVQIQLEDRTELLKTHSVCSQRGLWDQNQTRKQKAEKKTPVFPHSSFFLRTQPKVQFELQTVFHSKTPADPWPLTAAESLPDNNRGRRQSTQERTSHQSSVRAKKKNNGWKQMKSQITASCVLMVNGEHADGPQPQHKHTHTHTFLRKQQRMDAHTTTMKPKQNTTFKDSLCILETQCLKQFIDLTEKQQQIHKCSKHKQTKKRGWKIRAENNTPKYYLNNLLNLFKKKKVKI